MLRSYQYTEKPYLEYTLQGAFFRDKQVQIARRFVDAHLAYRNEMTRRNETVQRDEISGRNDPIGGNHPLRRDGERRCPVCGQQGSYFYSKWRVDYLCCTGCKSVYAVYDEETVEAYQKDDELLELRRSREYQQEITDNRQNVWEDFLEWIEVRAFRFMGRNKNLDIVDYGNRYEGYADVIRKASICGKYDLRESILPGGEDRIESGEADLVLYLDQMQQELHPSERMSELRDCLKEDGLLILNTRAGSGFDIITLKEKNSRIYPYEHILLPSVKGLVAFLERNGFEVLEITTPGVMDVKYVSDSIEGLDCSESFVRYLLEESSQFMLQEFQRFLQKACLSSFVSVIARKRRDEEKQDTVGN